MDASVTRDAASPRADRMEQTLLARARAVRRARLRGGDDGRGRGRRRRHQAAALQLLRQQGAALHRLHGAGGRRADGDGRRGGRRHAPTRATRCGAGVRAFFAFLDADRAAWAVLFDETLPRGGEIAERRRRLPRPHRRPGLRLAAGAAAARRATPRRIEVEALSAALLGAAEALARWWLRTEAIGADEAAELLIATIEPGLRVRSAPPLPIPDRRKRQRMNSKTRRVAVVGGNRIPFARSNSAYAHASNQDMLTAALDGLVDRFGLEGEALGEVAGGAVLKHSRDRDLDPRERARHPARPRDARLRRPAGLRHRPGDDDPRRQQDRPRARSTPASPAASTPPPTRRSALNEDLREILLDANRETLDRRASCAR